jgi:hypothetical protein
MENRKKFLDDFALKSNIKHLTDWRNISNLSISELGGSGILNYYNGSLVNCLESVYPGIFLNDKKKVHSD